MNKLLPLTALALLSAGCATTPKKFKYLSLGMTKAQVVDLLGDPYFVSATDGQEYLTYSYNRGPISGGVAYGGAEDYFVRLVGGKVNAYGRVGDFDSTKIPENTVNVKVEQR